MHVQLVRSYHDVGRTFVITCGCWMARIAFLRLHLDVEFGLRARCELWSALNINAYLSVETSCLKPRNANAMTRINLHVQHFRELKISEKCSGAKCG